MGTQSSLLIVGQGKRLAFHCNSDGFVGDCMAAIAASVAAYGLSALRQALAEVRVILPSDLDEEAGHDEDDPFDENSGFVYADREAWLTRAVGLAQARDQVPIGLDDAVWGFESVPAFSKAGLACLLTARLVVPTADARFIAQAPLTLGWGNGQVGDGYPVVVDLDRGLLLAWAREDEEDHDSEAEPAVYRLDLTALEGWAAEALEAQILALIRHEDRHQAALQTELQTQATGVVLCQKGLNALAHPQILNALPTRQALHGPSQHGLWTSLWNSDRDIEAWTGKPPVPQPVTALFRFPNDATWGPALMSGVAQAAARAGVAGVIEPLVWVQAPEGARWAWMNEVPMTLTGQRRVSVLAQELWRTHQVPSQVPDRHAQTGVDHGERAAFLADFQADQLNHLPESEVALAVQAIYSLDAAQWMALSEDLAPWSAEAMVELAQALDRTVLILTAFLHEPVSLFLTRVRKHALFQAVVAHLSVVAQARLRYVQTHPLPVSWDD